MVQERAKVTIYTNKDVTNVIKAKQFDALSRFLEVILVDDRGEPHKLSGYKVRFNARRPDGGKIFNNCNILDAQAGLIEVEFTDQVLAVPGRLQADISILSNDERLILTTRTFVVEVQAMIRDDEAIEGSNEYGAVLLLFQDVWDMREIILSIDERIGTLDDCLKPEEEKAGSSFGCALNRIWNYLKTQSTAGIVDMVNRIYQSVIALDVKTENVSSVIQTSVVKSLSSRLYVGSTDYIGTTTAVSLTGQGSISQLLITSGAADAVLNIWIDGALFLQGPSNQAGTRALLIPRFNPVAMINVGGSTDNGMQIYFSKTFRIDLIKTSTAVTNWHVLANVEHP